MKLVKTFTILPEIRQIFDLTLEIDLKECSYDYRWMDSFYKSSKRSEIYRDFLSYPLPTRFECIVQEGNRLFWKSHSRKTVHFYRLILDNDETDIIIDSESMFFDKRDMIIFFVRKDDTLEGGNLEFDFEDEKEKESLSVQESSGIIIDRFQKFRITPFSGKGVFSFIMIKFHDE
jgi:hypothetical protein